MSELFTLESMSAMMTIPQNLRTQGHLTRARRKTQQILVRTTGRAKTKQTGVVTTVVKLPTVVRMSVVRITVARMLS